MGDHTRGQKPLDNIAPRILGTHKPLCDFFTPTGSFTTPTAPQLHLCPCCSLQVSVCSSVFSPIWLLCASFYILSPCLFVFFLFIRLTGFSQLTFVKFLYSFPNFKETSTLCCINSFFNIWRCRLVGSCWWVCVIFLKFIQMHICFFRGYIHEIFI